MKKMKKIISICLAVTTTIWLTGVAMLVPVSVGAVAVVDGDLIRNSSAEGMAQFDIYIVKVVGDKKFKRLVLSPHVFESYEHFDKNGNGNNWDDVVDVDQATMDAQTTTDLVREDGVDNVYRLYAAEGADTGTRYWLDMTATAFLAVFDADAIYTINSTDVAGYTAGVNVTDASAAFPPADGVAGEVTLSLASDNPAAATLPTTAQGITFMSIKVAGTGTLSQLTLKRLGAGATTDFEAVYIYEDGVRLTSGRSISSATSKVTFINLEIEAPTTIQIVADMVTSGAVAGDVNYFGIENASDVTANATVGGTFPLAGNPMGVGGTAAGTLTVARSGSNTRNVTIGAKEVEISQLKVTASAEGTNIERIKLFNSGTASNTLITNLKIKDNTGVTVATATEIGDDGFVNFVFSPAYYIKKGDSEIFRVYADIGAVKPDRNLKLYLELATDILGTGTTYGYGMKATITSYDSDTYITVTCKGGDLTFNKVGPNAGGIGTKTDDTVFLEYTMSTAADITIKRTRLVVCKDDTGNGTYNTLSANAGADVTDIKISDKDTGTVVAGPKDGTSFDDAVTGTAAASCPGGVGGIYEDFTDTIDVTAGNTYTYQVTADIDVSAADETDEFAAGDIIKFIISSYASLVGTSGNVSYMKYTGTSDAVDDSAIVPSGHLAGEEMTLEAASLTVTLAAAPSGRDADANEKVYIAGQSGAEAVGLIFTAGAASDITINSIQTTAYIAETTSGTWTAGRETGSNYVKDTIANVYIYDDTNGGLIPGSTAKGFTSGTNFENTDFTGLSWTIPAGEAYTMMVVVDISSAAPASGSGTADTWISFDIATAADDISSVDDDGNDIAETADAPNGGTTPNTDFGVADYGTLAIDQASDTPDKSIVVMGTNDNEVSKFKLTGANEAWQIEKLSVVLDDGGGIDTEDRDNFSGVSLKYQTESQWDTDNWTISGQKTFGATASLAFAFSGSDRIFVPKDDDSFVTVLVDIQGYNGGTGAKSKKAFKIYKMDGSSDSFKAYGDQSGKQLVAYTTDSAAAADFNLHFVARSKPVFAKVAWGGGETELARFSITAVGEDIIFKNTDFDAAWGDNFLGSTAPASAYLEFDVVASGTDSASTSFYLYDWTETIVASAKNAGVYRPTTTEYDSGGFSNVATIGFHFEEGNLTKTIPGGTTKEFHVTIDGADITDFDNSDEYIYLKLTGDEGGNLATGAPMNRTLIYDDDTNEEGIAGNAAGSGDPEERFMVPGSIKNIGPLPITFRTLRGTVAP